MKIDLATWPRTAMFQFFRAFAEPFHGVCLRMDCTGAWDHAKANGLSVFLTLVHGTLLASHRVENMRLRVVDGHPVLFQRIHAGCAVGRPNGTIGFAHYDFHESLEDFVREASAEIERVRQRNDLERPQHVNLVRFSSLPWLDFTSLSHARSFATDDSAPRISFGKITEENGRRTLPVSIHVHHGLVDGSHVAEFVETMQAIFHAMEAAKHN